MPAFFFLFPPLFSLNTHNPPTFQLHTLSPTILPLSEQPFESPLIQNGCFLSSSSRKISSFSIENDTIPPHGTPSTLSPQLPSSESPSQEPLNFSIASRSLSSPHITISPIDFTSFTTDHSQQSWLPTPPPTQPLASSSNNSNSNNNNNNNSALEDFVLYPTPSAPHPQPHPRDSRLLAPSTSLRPSALQPFLAQNQPRRHSFSLQLQRHLQQQFSGSPVQDPRVTKLARSPSHWSNPNLVAHASLPHAASVPSRCPHRPPVPHFSSTHKVPTTHQPRKMSTFQDDDEFFAGLSAGLGSPYDFQLPLATDASAFSPGAQDGTVSPQELFIAGDSFPPSATFTELSTPSLENSGAFSYNTSPMIADDDAFGQQVWSSLFPEVSGIVPSVEEVKPEVAQAAPALTPAAKVTVSKPTSSPISATGTSKPSTVAGITRPRKELSPIAFDPKDPVAAKRARNTEAARKSRAKKLERQMSAEARIADLEQQIAERDALIAKLKAQLDTQKAFYQ